MKKLLILLLFITGCSGYTYNGMRANELKNLTWKHAAGAITSFAVHTLSHAMYMESKGYNWEYHITSEICLDSNCANDANIGRVGYIGQLLVGYTMKWLDINNDFTQGYNMATMFEIVCYPITNPLISDGSDINQINKQSNGNLEWAIYSVLAINLNFNKE